MAQFWSHLRSFQVPIICALCRKIVLHSASNCLLILSGPIAMPVSWYSYSMTLLAMIHYLNASYVCFCLRLERSKGHQSVSCLHSTYLSKVLLLLCWALTVIVEPTIIEFLPNQALPSWPVKFIDIIARQNCWSSLRPYQRLSLAMFW